MPVKVLHLAPLGDQGGFMGAPHHSCWEGAVVLCRPKAHVLNKEASPLLMNTGHSGAELMKVAQDLGKGINLASGALF